MVSDGPRGEDEGSEAEVPPKALALAPKRMGSWALGAGVLLHPCFFERQPSGVVKNEGPEVGLPGFKSWLYHSLALYKLRQISSLL